MSGQIIEKNIHHLRLSLVSQDNTDPNETAVKDVLAWLEKRTDKSLPEAAWQGGSFKHEAGNDTVEAVRANNDIWAMRYMFTDHNPHGSYLIMVNVTICMDVPDSIGIRVSYIQSSSTEVDKRRYSRPEFLNDWIERGIVRHCEWPVQNKPHELSNIEDLFSLQRLLEHPRRFLPIVMLSQTNSPDYSRFDGYALDADRLAGSCRGLAYVVKLSRDLSWDWSDIAEDKRWAVYDGAVRIYYPGADLKLDNPLRHPLILNAIIQQWPEERINGKTLWGAYAFEPHLVDMLLSDTSARRQQWPDLPSYAEVIEQFPVDLPALDPVSALENALQKAREDIQTLELERNRVKENYHRLALSVEKLRQEHRQQREYISKLEATIAELEQAIVDLSHPQNNTASSTNSINDLPQSYDEIPFWLESRYKGRIILHPRALQHLKRAQYQDISLVCRCLMLLAGEYTDMRRGTLPKSRFGQALRELGVIYSKTILDTSFFGMLGSSYYVKDLASGQQRALEWHLKKGGSRDDRYCLRIYFYWSENDKCPVIGALPGHLRNRLS